MFIICVQLNSILIAYVLDNHYYFVNQIFPIQELLELGDVVGTQSRGLSQESIALLPVSKYKCSFFLRRKSRSERYYFGLIYGVYWCAVLIHHSFLFLHACWSCNLWINRSKYLPEGYSFDRYDFFLFLREMRYETYFIFACLLIM